VEGRRHGWTIFIVQHEQRSRSHGGCDVTGFVLTRVAVKAT
jgi:hypothetical protein